MILTILAWCQLIAASLLFSLTVVALQNAWGDWRAVRKTYLCESAVFQHAKGAMQLALWRISGASLMFLLGVIMVAVQVATVLWVSRLAILLITLIELAKVSTDYFTRRHVIGTLQTPEQFVALQVLESLPEALLLINRRGNIRLVNHACEEMFGYSRDELMGRSVNILLADFKPAAQPTIERLTAKQKDGSKIAVEIHQSPLPTSYGLYVVALARVERKAS